MKSLRTKWSKWWTKNRAMERNGSHITGPERPSKDDDQRNNPDETELFLKRQSEEGRVEGNQVEQISESVNAANNGKGVRTTSAKMLNVNPAADLKTAEIVKLSDIVNTVDVVEFVAFLAYVFLVLLSIVIIFIIAAAC